MTGYERRDMGGWHLRVVHDRVAALAYLTAAGWTSFLPGDFFRWLRTAEPGSTYRLTQGVYQPELWVIRPPISESAGDLTAIPADAVPA